MSFKRVFDFATASFLLIVCSPIMLIVACLIKVNMGSPILFKQMRAGLYGSHFCIYKFRTMIDTKDDCGEFLADSVRLTMLGKFLRNFSLDELPQLYNVSKGDMSLIGPRPLLIRYLPYYNEEELLRHTVRPGITGLAQISGRNLLSWDERLALDVKYVKERTAWLDVKIFLLTFLRVVNSNGVVSVDETRIVALDEERAGRCLHL